MPKNTQVKKKLEREKSHHQSPPLNNNASFIYIQIPHGSSSFQKGTFSQNIHLRGRKKKVVEVDASHNVKFLLLNQVILICYTMLLLPVQTFPLEIIQSMTGMGTEVGFCVVIDQPGLSTTISGQTRFSQNFYTRY